MDPKTCLIVDDSRIIRKVARRIVESLGFEVDEAADGAEALAYCIGAMPDVVLVDWNMPVMDGLALIQELRAEPGYQELPVLVLTTEQAAQSKNAARGLGVCGWLNKPVEPDVLVELAAELLGEQPAA